jgi:hypothetical protein
MQLRLTIIFLLFCLGGFGQVKDTLKDTVYFLNNTMLAGELKKIRLGKIDFNGDNVGDVNIKYDRIKTISANTHFYIVETIKNEFLYGYIKRSDSPGCIVISSLAGDTTIKLINVASLSFYGRNWKDALTGVIGAGYSYTKSSDIGRLNMNASLNYYKKKLELAFTGDVIVTTDSIKTYKERENFGLSGSYVIYKSWFGGGAFNYQSNYQLGLKSRWQEVAGVGRKFLQGSHSVGKAATGIVVNEEQNLDNVSNTYTEALLQASYNFFSFSKPNISLSCTQSVYFSLSQKGRTRYDGDVNINWELIEDFSLDLSFFHNYDSKSPGTNTAKLDYGMVMGLNYKF